MNVLGLSNPLLLPGLTDAYTVGDHNIHSPSLPTQFMISSMIVIHDQFALVSVLCTLQDEGVQLYIEIRDTDSPGRKPDELVDTLLIDHNEPVGEESTTRVHSGIYEFVSMKLVIAVRCIENFQGSHCSQCVPGFTGMVCQQIDYCVGATNCTGNSQCVNGMDYFDCSCVPGFNGPDCQQIDYCVEVNCSGNGQCVNGMNSFNCSCDPGFTGEICQTNIDDCAGVNCSGSGWCMDDIDSFSCNCSAGYTGTQCEVNIDDCVGVNCSGNGWCVDYIDSFSCIRSAGYTGTQCEVNIDDCVGINCNGNGECLDRVNSFTCECSPGYTGQLCDIQGKRELPSGVYFQKCSYK